MEDLCGLLKGLGEGGVGMDAGGEVSEQALLGQPICVHGMIDIPSILKVSVTGANTIP